MRVTVAYVNLPRKEDAKYGNIKTTAGVTVMVPVAKLDRFRAGKTYDLQTDPQVWGKGEAARDVTVLVGDPAEVGGAPTPNYPQAIANYGQASLAPQDAQGASYAHQANVVQLGQATAPEAAYRPVRGNPEARSIYVTGIVGRAMGSGKFTASEIRVLTQEACEAYDKHMGSPPG